VKKLTNWFILYNNILYKRSYAQPLLHCVTSKMGKKILKELHEGVCSSHISRHVLAVTAIRTGSYWLSLREDAMNLVCSCDKCQKFTPASKSPQLHYCQYSAPYHSPPGECPYWGPFLKSRVNENTYWWRWTTSQNGLRPRLSPQSLQLRRKFIWKNVITRFRVPPAMIFDNGQQFDTTKVTDYLMTAVVHPQTNGQARRG